MEGFVVSNLVVLYLLFLIGLLVLQWYVAKWFAQIAADKGYYDRKYFWICFWLPGIGQLLVVAMPDRSRSYTAPPQSVPAYQSTPTYQNTPSYQTPPAYQNAPAYQQPPIQQRPMTHDDLPPL